MINLNSNKTASILCLLAIVAFLTDWFGLPTRVKELVLSTPSEEEKEVVDERALHYKFPVKYFARENVVAGLANGPFPDWREATVSVGARSFPTVDVTLTGYSNIPEDFSFGGSLDEYYTEKGFTVASVDEVDVTGDGVSERVVTLVDGRNHPPHAFEIFTEDQKIFSVAIGAGDATLLEDLQADPSGYGFTLSWYDWSVLEGLCCPTGRKLTRFVFEGGILRTYYEQTETFIKVRELE